MQHEGMTFPCPELGIAKVAAAVAVVIVIYTIMVK
ncbi:hypothetical protein ANO14919_132940 [Xylariales sp. No.14919]|nr:hypothetical protein ANO14919_132940 [Xylariales sp. No.14919]